MQRQPRRCLRANPTTNTLCICEWTGCTEFHCGPSIQPSQRGASAGGKKQFTPSGRLGLTSRKVVKRPEVIGLYLALGVQQPQAGLGIDFADAGDAHIGLRGGG